jgi:hypothetical protein
VCCRWQAGGLVGTPAAGCRPKHGSHAHLAADCVVYPPWLDHLVCLGQVDPQLEAVQVITASRHRHLHRVAAAAWHISVTLLSGRQQPWQANKCCAARRNVLTACPWLRASAPRTSECTMPRPAVIHCTPPGPMTPCSRQPDSHQLMTKDIQAAGTALQPTPTTHDVICTWQHNLMVDE